MKTLATLRDAVRDTASSAPALSELGHALMTRREFREGITCLRAAVGARPGEARWHLELGSALFTMGAYEDSAESFAQALALEPASWKAAGALGQAYALALDRLGEAPPLCVRAIEGDPDDRSPYIHLARAVMDEGSARRIRERLVRLMPPNGRLDYLEFGLAAALMHVGRYEDARECLHRLLGLDLTDARALVLLGRAEQVMGEDAAATAHFALARLLPPLDHLKLNAYVTHAWRLGDYGRVMQTMRSDEARRLHGIPDYWAEASTRTRVRGRTILLKETTLGYGDAIQWVRIARPVHDLGARVVLECLTPTRRLFASMPGIDEVVVPHDEYPPWDEAYYCVHLASFLDWTWETLPSQVPYLFVPPAIERAWAARVAKHGPGFHVGVEWRARNDLIDKLDPYTYRSMPAAELRPLTAIDGVIWHALHVGADGLRELTSSRPPLPIAPLSAGIGDFMDTAAAVSALDAVVTVDTAVANVAGALGKPTLLMLPYYVDWRWGSVSSPARFYPSIRTFRQQRPGVWSTVIDEVAAALRAMARSGSVPHATSIH